MSRSLAEIQKEILTQRESVADLSTLEVLTNEEATVLGANSTSKVAGWRLWVYIVAFVIFLHEKIVESNAEKSRPHTLPWYRNQAFNFIDGLELQWIDGQFSYDTTGITDIEARKVIDRCAVIESVDGELLVKIATDVGGVLQPLATAVFTRFKRYMGQIKDAGNRIVFINKNPDELKITLKVYVDETMLDLTTGELLTDPGTKPVEIAVNDYLANLEFNGAFVKEFFRDTIQKAVSVKLPVIEEIQYRYAGLPYQNMGDWVIPDAGYYKIDQLTITYLPYELE